MSQEADLKIRKQNKTGTSPGRLNQKDWQSGDTNWRLDMIAADRKAIGQVIADFRQIVHDGALRVHPLVAGPLDDAMRGKMLAAGKTE